MKKVKKVTGAVLFVAGLITLCSAESADFGAQLLLWGGSVAAMLAGASLLGMLEKENLKSMFNQ